MRIKNAEFARYQEKRWVPRDAKEKSSSTVRETNGSIYRPGPGSSCWHGYTKNTKHSSEERKYAHPPRTYDRIITSKGSVPVDVDLSYQVCIGFFLFSIGMEKIRLDQEESDLILLYLLTHTYLLYFYYHLLGSGPYAILCIILWVLLCQCVMCTENFILAGV